ncbi:MAG: hypothetical protein OYK82_04235 [Gammaproteobacteria bacterium]|nr:hypothetical protein [Gammaproteobacteria bacterium]
MADDIRLKIAASIDAIEGAYEYFLAYAAQGITEESNSGRVGAQLRTHLDAMAAALGGLGPQILALIEEGGSDATGDLAGFQAVVEADARRALAVVALVRARESVTSQLVDNLNASVHVRTALTDLFILDEVLKLGVDRATLPEGSEPEG